MKHRASKNQSMNSTHHMSCNQSTGDHFYPESKCASALLNYAHIPMGKPVPEWNQSASTWRYTSRKSVFPKDTRFKNASVPYTDFIEPQMPSELSSKTCTLGFGTRKPISSIVLRNAKEKPAPNCYNLTFRGSSISKSFGIGWENYEKMYLTHRKDVYAEFHTENNPAAKYEVRKEMGSRTKFTAHGRLKMYTQRMSDNKNWVPGPRYLLKDQRFGNTAGLNERNFSFGERLDLSKPANDYPSAKYHIPGFCERFTKLRSACKTPQ